MQICTAFFCILQGSQNGARRVIITTGRTLLPCASCSPKQPPRKTTRPGSSRRNPGAAADTRTKKTPHGAFTRSRAPANGHQRPGHGPAETATGQGVGTLTRRPPKDRFRPVVDGNRGEARPRRKGGGALRDAAPPTGPPQSRPPSLGQKGAGAGK